MGGTHSETDKRRQIRGGIFVQIPKTGFISGEAIQGMLCVNLEENFTGHVLQVSLEGTEISNYTYTVSSGSGKHRHTRTVYAHGSNKFVDFAVPVYDFALGQMNNNFVLSPGQWQIPFQIIIANQLPSSFNYHYSQNTNGSLKYRLVASIIPTDPNIKPVIGAQDIFIAQQINLIPSEQIQSKSVAPNTCCCCCSDTMNISCSTDKPSYAPGEEIQVSINSDLTNYTKKVISMNVELKSVLTMKTQHQHRIKTIQITSIVKNVPVQTKDVKERVQISIPNNLNLTCNGTLVNLAYKVKITPVVDGCCQCNSVDNNSCIFPVIINPTSTNLNMIPMPQQLIVQAPQNWNPQQLQPAQFTSEQAAYIQRQQTQYTQIELMAVQQQNQMPLVQNPMLNNNGQVYPNQNGINNGVGYQQSNVTPQQMNQQMANGGGYPQQTSYL